MGVSIGLWNHGDRLAVAALVLVTVLWKERQLKIAGYVRKWPIQAGQHHPVQISTMRVLLNVMYKYHRYHS